MMSVREIKREEEERERKRKEAEREIRREEEQRERKEEERARKRQLREERRLRAVAAVQASGRRHLLSLPEVEATVHKKKSAIYADPTFPDPVPTGARGVGWLADEVAAWLEARIAERDRPARTRSLPLRSYQAEASAHKEPKSEPPPPHKSRARVPLNNSAK